MKKLFTVIVLLASVIFSAPGQGLSAGDAFADFTGVDINSKQVKLSDYAGKGKYVLMEFWASWCGPCRKTIPLLKEIYDEYSVKGLVMVSVDASERDIRDGFAAAGREGIVWHTIFSKESTPCELYDVQYIPRAILIGPDGKIVSTEVNIYGLPAVLDDIYGKK